MGFSTMHEQLPNLIWDGQPHNTELSTANGRGGKRSGVLAAPNHHTSSPRLPAAHLAGNVLVEAVGRGCLQRPLAELSGLTDRRQGPAMAPPAALAALFPYVVGQG